MKKVVALLILVLAALALNGACSGGNDVSGVGLGSGAPGSPTPTPGPRHPKPTAGPCAHPGYDC